MADPDSIVAPIKRTLRGLVIATVVLAVVLLGSVVWVYVNANVTGDALCALRGDLERRVETSKDFLVEHPKGIPGISAQTIKQGLANQQRTITALSGLNC